MVMGPYILHTDQANLRAFKILICAEYNEVNIEIPPFKLGVDNLTADFLSKSPAGKVPVLETPRGTISESNAITRFIADIRRDTELFGETDIDRGAVDGWLEVCTNDIEVLVSMWLHPVFGFIPFDDEIYVKAKRDLGNILKLINNHLAERPFLVGEDVTLADIAICSALFYPFTLVIDPDFRSYFPDVVRWFSACVRKPEFEAVMGQMVLAEVELAPATLQKPLPDWKAGGFDKNFEKSMAGKEGVDHDASVGFFVDPDFEEGESVFVKQESAYFEFGAIFERTTTMQFDFGEFETIVNPDAQQALSDDGGELDYGTLYQRSPSDRFGEGGDLAFPSEFGTEEEKPEDDGDLDSPVLDYHNMFQKNVTTRFESGGDLSFPEELSKNSKYPAPDETLGSGDSQVMYDDSRLSPVPEGPETTRSGSTFFPESASEKKNVEPEEEQVEEEEELDPTETVSKKPAVPWDDVEDDMDDDPWGAAEEEEPPQLAKGSSIKTSDSMDAELLQKILTIGEEDFPDYDELMAEDPENN